MLEKVLCNLITKNKEALDAMQNSINRSNINLLIEKINNLEGKIIFVGLGKSGLIAQKIAASLSSIACPAIFLHTHEALHGDLGLLTQKDLVIFLSNSGEGREISYLLDYCEKRNIYTAGLSSQENSTLIRRCQLPFVLPKIAEASNLNIPTTSVSMMLLWGDLIMLLLVEMRGLTYQDYLELHPAGTIGLMGQKASDLMIGIEKIPEVSPEANYYHITKSLFQAASNLLMVAPDGIISRSQLLEATEEALAYKIMKKPLIINKDQYLRDIFPLLQVEKILFVADQQKIIGLLDYDIFS